MLDKSEKIIWMSTADGSWGGCERGDLIIVRRSDLTADERSLIDTTDDGDNAIEDVDGTVYRIVDILSAAEARIHRDTCLCPKDTYNGDNDNSERN